MMGDMIYIYIFEALKAKLLDADFIYWQVSFLLKSTCDMYSLHIELPFKYIVVCGISGGDDKMLNCGQVAR